MELEEAIKEVESLRLELGLYADKKKVKQGFAVEEVLNYLTKQKKMIKEHEKMIIRHKEQLRKAGIYGYDYDLKVLTEESE